VKQIGNFVKLSSILKDLKITSHSGHLKLLFMLLLPMPQFTTSRVCLAFHQI